MCSAKGLFGLETGDQHRSGTTVLTGSPRAAVVATAIAAQTANTTGRRIYRTVPRPRIVARIAGILPARSLTILRAAADKGNVHRNEWLWWHLS